MSKFMLFGALRDTRAARGTKLSHSQSKLAVGECTQVVYRLVCQANHHRSLKQWLPRYNLTSAAMAAWRGRLRGANRQRQRRFIGFWELFCGIIIICDLTGL